MIRVWQEAFAPGMRVAEPVCNSQSVLLLKAGTVLTPRNIKTLRTWGVETIFIEGSGKEHGLETGEARTGAEKAMAKTLGERFSDLPDDPVMAEIMRVAGSQILKRAL